MPLKAAAPGLTDSSGLLLENTMRQQSIGRQDELEAQPTSAISEAGCHSQLCSYFVL
jgi:hypothetical protein